MYLLFEMLIFVLELVILEGEVIKGPLGLLVHGYVFVFGFSFLLEALDEGDNLLFFFGRQVVQNVCPLASRHLNLMYKPVCTFNISTNSL